jgi:hypothetical protein
MRLHRGFVVAIALAILATLGVSPVSVQAQSNQETKVKQLVAGLVNVDVGAVAVNIGNITVEDLVNVNDVLNNAHISVLDKAINNSPIADHNSDILTNLFREGLVGLASQVRPVS